MKIFAVSFGVGVVSGIVMSFQFGTNWAVFPADAGNIGRPLLNDEVRTAFFVEASFLGIMLFGWDRVGHKTHFACTVAVAAGTQVAPFVLSLSFFLLGFIGLVVGIWPNIVPTSMTTWDAASPVQSQGASCWWA